MLFGLRGNDDSLKFKQCDEDKEGTDEICLKHSITLFGKLKN